MDISPKEHVDVMAQFQKYVDNSISKTINVPNSFSLNETAKIIEYAYELACKGITIYRDGCRESQALMTKTQTKLSAFRQEDVSDSVQTLVENLVEDLYSDDL